MSTTELLLLCDESLPSGPSSSSQPVRPRTNSPNRCNGKALVLNVNDGSACEWTPAHVDPVLIHDDRVLKNLLYIEDRYAVNASYFHHVQRDQKLVKPYMRRELATWMLGVCEDQMCHEEVFPLAMNYVDRYLSVQPTEKSVFQALGAACLFLSSKLKESKPLHAYKLCAYTDYSVSIQQLMRWELVVLNTLRWDVAAVTPCDFLDHILVRLAPVSSAHRNPQLHHKLLKIKSHAQTFISLCAIDTKLLMYPASMISAAAIAVAASGLNYDGVQSEHDLHRALHTMTGTEMDCLREVIQHIEEMVKNYIASAEEKGLGEQNGDEKFDSKPETPVDLQDIEF